MPIHRRHAPGRVLILESGRLVTRRHTGSPNGVAGGLTLISVIAPSLIFEEVDIQKTKEPLQKRPLVPSPIGK